MILIYIEKDSSHLQKDWSRLERRGGIREKKKNGEKKKISMEDLRSRGQLHSH